MAETIVRGGKNLLDRVRTSDENEKDEPLNERDPDLLNEAIAAITHDKPIAILTHQFEITHPLTRPDYITFDRYYPKLRLLVDFVATPREGTADKNTYEDELVRRQKFAKERKLKYLPVYDGTVTPEELKAAVA